MKRSIASAGGFVLVAAASLLLGGCSNSAKQSGSHGTSATPVSTPVSGSSTAAESSSGPVSGLPGSPKDLGITSVKTASAIAVDGSAKDPRTTFKAASDRTIVAVIALAKLPAGTKISYIRYLDGKFANSKSAVLKKAAKYFYFKFTAVPGKSIAKGQYRLRVYVNGRAAWESIYKVV